MSNNTKIVIAVLVGAVVGLGVSAVFPRESSLGGVYSTVSKTFSQGIKVGTTDQFQVDSSGRLSIIGTGTTTLTHRTTSSVASCLNLTSADGAAVRAYVTTADNAWRVELGSCP
jgi:uncharacterized membrane-anchored protein YitT (DUF2179 family)